MKKFLLAIVLAVSINGYCQVPFVEFKTVPQPTLNIQRSRPIFETPRTTNVYIHKPEPDVKLIYDEVEKVKSFWLEKEVVTNLSIRTKKYSDGSMNLKVLGYEYNGKMILANDYAVTKLSDLIDKVDKETATILLNWINEGFTTTIQINDFNFFL